MDAKKDLRWFRGWTKLRLFCQCSANNTLFGRMGYCRIGPLSNGIRDEATCNMWHQTMASCTNSWDMFCSFETPPRFAPSNCIFLSAPLTHINKCLLRVCWVRGEHKLHYLQSCTWGTSMWKCKVAKSNPKSFNVNYWVIFSTLKFLGIAV